MTLRILSSIAAAVLAIMTPATVTAQTQADSTAFNNPANWSSPISEDHGCRLIVGHFNELFGAPQHISVYLIPGHLSRNIYIGISDSLAHTSVIAGANHAFAAVNGSYFDMKRGNSVCFLKAGAEVIDSTSMGMAVNGAIRCGADGLEILPWDSASEKSYNVHSGRILATGPLLISNGTLQEINNVPQEFGWAPHPRTALAMTSRGDILFITADGRHENNAKGVTLPELAWIMKQLNATDAINLDGGGSTTLWTETMGVVNNPSDNRKFDHEGQRGVPNIIYVSK